MKRLKFYKGTGLVPIKDNQGMNGSKDLLKSLGDALRKREQARASESKREQARASESKREQARASESKREQGEFL